MSRIGAKPINLPAGVSVKVKGREITVSGPKGTIDLTTPYSAKVDYDDSKKVVSVTRIDDTKQSRANHGLVRALIANMVEGVTNGYEKRLEIYGTGYNCKLQGKTLHLNVGFTGRNRGKGSQFELPLPSGIEVVVEKEAARGDTEPAELLVRGIDKQQVGQFAAEVRAIRKTEPYKGKGIRYKGEQVRRKQGKALTSG